MQLFNSYLIEHSIIRKRVHTDIWTTIIRLTMMANISANAFTLLSKSNKSHGHMSVISLHGFIRHIWQESTQNVLINPVLYVLKKETLCSFL